MPVHTRRILKMIHLHSVCKIDGCCLTHAYVCRYGIAALDVLTYHAVRTKAVTYLGRERSVVITDKSDKAVKQKLKIHKCQWQKDLCLYWQKNDLSDEFILSLSSSTMSRSEIAFSLR